jgi:hypothetical protein
MSSRSLKVKSLPCLACQQVPIEQIQATEEHHLCISSGQKRLGDAYSVALCRWHHTGDPAIGFNAGVMESLYGPSMARSPKSFRHRFGSDAYLLNQTNKLLETL